MKFILYFLTFVLVFGPSSLAQERILISSMGLDSEYRVALCGRILGSTPHEKRTRLTSGKAILEALRGQPIRLWVHFSHGSAKRLYGNSARYGKSYLNSGLTIVPASSKYDEASCRSLDDLDAEIREFKKITFTEDAVIYLGSCWIGTPDTRSGQVSFAQRLANITGATVIAGRERTEPLRETYSTLRYTNNAKFFKFRPHLPPEELSESFDLSALLREQQQPATTP